MIVVAKWVENFTRTIFLWKKNTQLWNISLSFFRKINIRESEYNYFFLIMVGLHFFVLLFHIEIFLGALSAQIIFILRFLTFLNSSTIQKISDFSQILYYVYDANWKKSSDPQIWPIYPLFRCVSISRTRPVTHSLRMSQEMKIFK